VPDFSCGIACYHLIQDWFCQGGKNPAKTDLVSSIDRLVELRLFRWPLCCLLQVVSEVVSHQDVPLIHGHV
jgi:hypothetical protein